MSQGLLRDVAPWARGPLVQGQSRHSHSQWRDWVVHFGWNYLKSKKSDLGTDPEKPDVLGRRLCDWLLDRGRWKAEGYGATWGQPATRRSEQFVIASIEAWPEEEMLAELRDAGGGQKAPMPPPPGGCVDLLSWWVIVDRGLKPTPPATDNDAREPYGVLAATRAGGAVRYGLKLNRLTTGPDSGSDGPKLWSVLRRIFDFSLYHTFSYFYCSRFLDAPGSVPKKCRADKWQILQVARHYKPSAGDAWGYLHTAIARNIEAFLDSHDPDIDVPGIHVRDTFRQWLKDVRPEVPVPQRPGMEDAADRLGALHPDRDSEPAYGDAEEGPEEMPWEAQQRQLARLQAVLGSLTPLEQAVFIFAFTPTDAWTKEAVQHLASEWGASTAPLLGLVKKKAARLASDEGELVRTRVEACLEKLEYLRVLAERTRDNLLAALEGTGLDPDAAEAEADRLAGQVVPGETRRKDLPAPPSDRPYDSADFLAPRFQQLLWEAAKMRGHVLRHTREMMYSKDELDLLARAFGLARRRDVDEALRKIIDGLGLGGEPPVGGSAPL